MINLDRLRETIMPILAPYVSEVALFGSVARGEETEQSDIDLLVTFKRPVSLFTLVRLEQELTQALGRQVDLLTDGSISPYILPYVEKDKIVLYGEIEPALSASHP